ncbi:ribosomal protection-like ABC-F family protein [Bacillus horti]|uniref:ATPase subunit of ABC transporter with duplicated ATPase domains n=1 Tax=Caldalkalibacillus horti TaxID=77523 RepID=A0ABT9VZ02_9BACI|nr:ABC-F family ATP-binding cassette domain-containing protein [Bacillus horti]MDQ0166228.1 ATPase subunit of ABC transporter with duplicated ATPase domains [Bacillus horti]
MMVISIQKATCMYGANTIFTQLSCDIKQGERIGIIGRNGEGKTTLLKLMASQTEAHEGQVLKKKGLSVGILEQIPNVSENQKVKQILIQVFEDVWAIKQRMAEIELRLAQPVNDSALQKDLERYGELQELFEQKNGYEVDSQIAHITNGLQIVALLEKQWGQLSGGERTKVGLAQILLKSPDFLLLDEPTNHLDLSSIEWLASFVQSYKGTIAVVSHDRYFLDEVVTGIFELDQGELHVYHTNYTGYVREREERLVREFQQFQDQQKKIKKMKEAIKRLKDWANRSNPPSAGLHRRAKNMERALHRIEVLKKPVLEQKQMGLSFQLDQRSGEDVFVLDNICKRYGEKELLKQASMHIRFGERIAIVGDNGSGKTTLLKMLLGAESPDSGFLKQGSSLSVGYLSQHAQEMNPKRTLIEEFRDQVPVTEGEARGILAQFLFYGHMVFQKVHALSGGERMRLRWAQLVYQNHNVLILDEPTNHLDIDSKEVLEEALSRYKGTVIAVSHDRYFLDRFFPVTYWISDQQLTRYEGNYSFAKEKRKAQEKD